jgi:hypothetical protein
MATGNIIEAVKLDKKRKTGQSLQSSSIFDAFIKMADPDYYPSIRETFHILLTMPMGSVKKHMNTLIFC